MATHVGTLMVHVVGDASRLASALGSAEKTIERFGSRMFFLGGRMAAGVTLPIVGLMTSINRVGKEFDKAMTESLAIMNDVDAEMRERMEKQAIDISRNSKFAAKEVAEGYYDLASAGFKAADVLGSLGTVTTFAQAGLMSMSTAGEHLAGSVNALGVNLTGAQDKAGAMARVADVLTAEVILDASGSDAGGGDPLYYVWLEAGVAIATGETPTVELDINVHTITLLFANDIGGYATDTVVITVTAP